MLRKIRIGLAALFFIAITLMFLGLSGTLTGWFAWMAKLQFLPAVLAVNVGAVVLILVLTVVFGRIYCSVICPMGVYQDVVSNISGRRKGKKMRFSYSGEKKWLRRIVAILYFVALCLGINVVVALLAPYSSYGRAVQSVFGIHGWGHSWPTIAVSAGTLVLIGILAWRNGRTWCNTVCPVGTVLGIFSKYAIFRPVIDTDKCVNCNACGKKCKASCIDTKNHAIDYSRCVDCFDCIDNCSVGAISYKFAYKQPAAENASPAKAEAAPGKAEQAASGQPDESRRAFLATTAVVATGLTLGAQNKKLDGGLAPIVEKQKPERTNPLTPFGSKSVDNFYTHCTACQLCVSACPNDVLRPSTSLDRFMQPEMSYERGYCRPECVKCSEVCPAGAIIRVTPQEKAAIHIGIAKVERELCIGCGHCARRCPAGAILMVPADPNDEKSPRIPAVDESKCIGCGECEYLCPVRPLSAITVDGRQVHIKE